MGEAEVRSSGEAEVDDFGFREGDKGRTDGEIRVPLDAGFGGEVSHVFEGLDELWAAVRVAGIVNGVDTDEDGFGANDFGVREGEGEEDGVAGGDVSDGDARAHFGGRAVFGHVDFSGEGGAAEGAEIDVGDAKRVGTQVSGHSFGGSEFLVVALAVVEGKGVGFEAFLTGNGETSGGIEASAKEADCAGHG